MSSKFRSFAGRPVLRFTRLAAAAGVWARRNPAEPERLVIQPGVTIGADPDCAVCIEGDGIKDIHVRITRDERGRVWAHAETSRPFQTADDQSVWAMELKPGEGFKVGPLLFECEDEPLPEPADAPPTGAEKHVKKESHASENAAELIAGDPETAPFEPPKPAEPQRASTGLPPLLSLVDELACPRCHSPIAHLPLVARFCPHCGAPLPAERPAAPEAAPAMPDEHAAQFLGWLLPLIQADAAQRPVAFSMQSERPATLIAYINTLLHLGIRYEAGVGGMKNLAQAMRYYRKAAKLGNELAQARVAVDLNRPAAAEPSASRDPASTAPPLDAD